jgi:hypothetical protein
MAAALADIIIKIAPPVRKSLLRDGHDGFTAAGASEMARAEDIGATDDYALIRQTGIFERSKESFDSHKTRSVLDL